MAPDLVAVEKHGLPLTLLCNGVPMPVAVTVRNVQLESRLAGHSHLNELTQHPVSIGFRVILALTTNATMVANHPCAFNSVKVLEQVPEESGQHARTINTNLTVQASID